MDKKYYVHSPYRNSRTSICLLLLLCLMASCRPSRNTTDAERISRKQQDEHLLPLAKPIEGQTDLTARMAVSIDLGGRSLPVKGQLRMRRDEVIQFSFTALGVVEIAYVECTPQTICIVDRVGKRYVEFDYSSGLLQRIGVSFATVQALFWNRMFLPGEDKAWEHLEDFKISTSGTQRLVAPRTQRPLQCWFYTDSEFKQLMQTQLQFSHYEGMWRYDSFRQTDGHTFPSVFDVSLSGSTHSIAAHIELSNLSFADKSWKSGTNLSRYEKVELSELLSILKMLQ